MYSMKRTTTPVPRKWASKSISVWSLTPRCTTVLILMGARPARRACSMPSSTSLTPPKPPLIFAKTSGSSVSRLTVIRCRPAALSSLAYLASSMPLVVSAMSSMPGSCVRSPIRSARLGRSSGSPPVMRIFLTPARTNTRARRRISSKSRRSLLFRKRYDSWKVSRGMQYGQRKLQRSMTEMRRSWMGRRSVSTGPRPVVPCRTAERGTTFSRTVIDPSPAEEPRDESFWIGIRARRKFHESIGARERGEVTGAVGRRGLGGGAAPVVGLEFHRQVESQRCLDLERGGDGDARRLPRRLAHGGAQRGQHVARQAHQCRHRVAGQREHRRSRLRNAEPHGFAGALRDVVEHQVHAQLLEHLGHQVHAAHGHAAREDQHVVRAQVEVEPLGELRLVV